MPEPSSVLTEPSNQTQTTQQTGAEQSKPLFGEETLKAYPSLSKFKDYDSFGKSYGEMEKSRGGSIKLPGEDATPEQWDEFYGKMGRPESPDKYGLTRPTLPEGANWPEETEKSFLTTAHKLGLSAKQAQGLMDWFGGDVGQNMAAQQQVMMAGQESLRTSWGADYDKNLSLAKRAASEFIKDDEAKAFFTATGAHQHPVVLKLFSEIGKRLQEDSAEHGNGNQEATKSALAKIAEIRNDPKHPHNNPNMAGHKEAIQEMARLYGEAYPD